MITITRLFDFPYYQLEHYNLDKAFTSKQNGEWYSVSTQEYINQANAISRGLIKLGVKPNDKIAVTPEDINVRTQGIASNFYNSNRKIYSFVNINGR